MAGGSNGRIYIRQTFEDNAEVSALSERWTNLADERLGAEVIGVSDEFYAPAQRMLNPKPANYYHHDEDGMRWVDGWETTRRRQEGHEHCIIRLGRRGSISAVVFDTSFFTGNFPVGVEVAACNVQGDPDASTSWTPLTGFVKLAGNAQRLVETDAPGFFTHVRLQLHPDGGMARLRVFGRVDPTVFGLDGGLVDLAALENGGRVIGCNDNHFGSTQALIAPGPSVTWGKGWETRRRREPGHDWAVIELGRPGQIDHVEIDTKYYLANQPEAFSLQAARLARGTPEELVLNQAMFWPELLGRQTLRGGAVLQIDQGLASLGEVTHVRLNIFPDGGVTRLRLFGRVAALSI